jgi:hypothetical protein
MRERGKEESDQRMLYRQTFPETRSLALTRWRDVSKQWRDDDDDGTTHALQISYVLYICSGDGH